MKKLILFCLLIIANANIFAQDAIWTKTVENWEKSKTVNPQTVKKSFSITAHGTNGDENKGGATILGDYLPQENGKYKINVKRIEQKSGVTEVDGNPTKESYDDLQHALGSAIFAKENQQYIKVEPSSLETTGNKSVYQFESKIPGQENVKGKAIIDNTNGIPVKIVISKSKQNDNAGSKGKITINYIEGKPLVNEYKIENEVNFFGNGATEKISFVFSY